MLLKRCNIFNFLDEITSDIEPDIILLSSDPDIVSYNEEKDED